MNLTTKALFKFKKNFTHQERHRPSKATMQRNVGKYQLNDSSLNLTKERSGRRVTIETAENIQAVQEALEVNNGCLSARRNGLDIPASSLSRITKKTFVGILIK